MHQGLIALKYPALLLLVVAMATSCTPDESPELQSRWQLIAYLADPGDGSGQFVPVNSEKTIALFDDGTFQSNGTLCQMDASTGQGSSGTYSEAESTITPDDCSGSPLPIMYVLENGHLILSYPCFEPCREKYAALD